MGTPTAVEKIAAENKLMKEFNKYVPEKGREHAEFYPNISTNESETWVFELGKELHKMKYEYDTKKVKLTSTAV